MRLTAFIIQYLAVLALGLGTAYWVATAVSAAVQDSLTSTAQLIKDNS